MAGRIGRDRLTVNGSDYLCDQDAIEILCNEALDDVYELGTGAPSSRGRHYDERSDCATGTDYI